VGTGFRKRSCADKGLGGRIVPLHAFLGNTVFRPDDLAVIGAAFDAALARLRLSDRTDPLTEIVAKNIIALAAHGERDPGRLCERALAAIGGEKEAAKPDVETLRRTG
jgi:hypothetical protein